MSVVQHEWWGELRHGGMLVAPQFLDELIPELAELDEHGYDRLRSAWLRLDAALYGGVDIDEARRSFAGELLEGFLALHGWQKASSVAAEFKATSIMGEALRPGWVLPDPESDGALLAVWFDGSDTVGRGRGVRAQAKLVELLRATGVPLGLLTNGRQFRLVHAGPDYDAWAEWDAQTWFDESEGRETLRGLAALLRSESGGALNRLRALIRTIHDSRNRQGDLAQVLGEQVRQGIELLVREVDHKLAADSDLNAALWTDPGSGQQLSDDEALAAIYQAATRVVMRLVLVLYAEARDLLPANVEAYHDSYGVGSLYDTLTRADRDARDALGEATSAWPRILSLFRLVYFGSGHADLPVRAYGGQLFRPGDASAPEPALRALSALETTRPTDAVVYRLLRLLKVGKVKIRAGRGSRWVAGAVDFSDLRTEYVGIVYEGLLDYELRRAAAEDPIVLLNVGRQPALPLSRLSELSASELKELLKAFKDARGRRARAMKLQAEETGSEETAESGDTEETEADELAADEDAQDELDDDAHARVGAWACAAVEAAGLIRRPRGGASDAATFDKKVAARADKLVAGVIPPGRLYLVASGGLRKGSGSFYTRPALSVPLAQRALEPLCYQRDGDRFVPRLPEDILGLKVCEPAMGSGSFLVAALRYLVEALHRSLEHYGRIKPKDDRETVVTLPYGAPATGEEREELLPLPPEDDRFPQMLRSRLARHVVERCLYGVDINPMAVELARLALWVETLDRDLPFEYLDHKLKVGNSLVGCWLHLVDDYPIRALDREDADGKNGVRTKWLKQAFKDAKAQLPAVIHAMGGATQLFDAMDEPVDTVVARVRARFEALHDVPRDQQDHAYRELLASEEYLALKHRMDTWCALWFWPAGEVDAPMPQTWRAPAPEAIAVVEQLASAHRFFHWEVEFSDAFTSDRAGFDVVLGNPPWETLQPESLEFFSRHDPLYRTYGKTEALAKQQELFSAVAGLEHDWIAYQGGFKSMANVAKAAGDPFDVSLARGDAGARLAGGWEIARRKRSNLAHRSQPYGIQGSGKVYTYKLFAEAAYHLLRDGGRLGMLVPSGIYTDQGTTELRKRFLQRCSWEWCYGFENRAKLFPIDSRYKFVPIVVERGGSTDSVKAAFMRHDVTEWERPGEHVVELAVKDIQRFAAATWSFMELKDGRDLDLVDRIYADHPLLGRTVADAGGAYSQELNMTSDAKHFVSRSRLENEGVLSEDDDTRDPRVRARLRAVGYLPLYEGKCFWIHDPYYHEVRKFVRVATAEAEVDSGAWKLPRLCMRNVASSTNQRTYIVGMMPPTVHGNSSPTINGLDWSHVLMLNGILTSLVVDYVVRMKVSANLNWFYLETVPIPARDNHAYWAAGPDLVERLNAIGSDFPTPSTGPLVRPADRLAARLVLDSLVADLFDITPDDLAHIATGFSIYDRDAGEAHCYPNLAVQVYAAFAAGGLEVAARRATQLAAARATAGVGFGFDELWQPDSGWKRANAEAREIVSAGAPHLMALNPIQFAGQVIEEFRRYQLTAFPIADPRLATQASALLGAGAFRDSPLTKGPYVSLARGFREGRVDALVQEGVVHAALPGVAEFPSLFAHQDETLRAALAGRHVLISTGTGSGKTESFLYPIIDRCLRMRDADEPEGVVAVLVYPMNALAADQRDRLRLLLAGTGITYGMYVGSTPRRPSDSDVTHLGEGEGREALLAARRKRKANDLDVVPFEECASEQEIRERKPRILITNANQLELLITRQQDFELFTGAPLSFIVLDEAHTYSGATGAEVACLVRRLRAFAGKGADQVTCIATSATIVDPEHGAEVAPEFLARLCGVQQDKVELVTERYAELDWPGARSIPAEPDDPDAVLAAVLDALGTAQAPGEGEAEDDEADVDRDALADAVAALTGARPELTEGGIAEGLFEHLARMEPVRILAEELEHARDLAEVTATLRTRLARTGLPPETTTAEVLAYLALGAFARRGDVPLLRPKLHVFVRGLEGAVVTFDGDPPDPRLWFSAGEALAAGNAERQATAVFPLSVCRTCGQHYLTTYLQGFALADGDVTGGEASGDSAYWLASPDSEAEGAVRVRFTDWFLAEADPEDEEDGNGNGRRSKATARLDERRSEAWLCTQCGCVHRDEADSCSNPQCAQPGPLARIYLVHEPKAFRCLGCGATGRSGTGRDYEPIRPLRASTVADVHILAQEMISAAGTDDERHLLIFADNRQDAAFQAGWMRDHARRYRLRYLMREVLGELELSGGGPVSVGDLHGELLRRLRADRDLARAIAPEAFDSGADESFGRGAAAQLSRFLRIQILRELATSFTQRDGLERWGQLRVVYSGLTPDGPGVRELAAELEMAPEALCDGTAALLDAWRRARMLHDADEPIFERWWTGGSEEVQRGFIPFGFTEVRPVGIKLERQGGEVDKWVRTVVSTHGRTGAIDFIRKWGVEDPRAAAERIWEFLRSLDLVTPVKLIGGNDKPLGGSGGAHQVDASRIGLKRQSERYICTVCRRVHARATPNGACTKIHCAGTVEASPPPTDDYNVSLLTRPFAMVTAEEHTAQVPADERFRIEKEFKRRGGTVNTLVASPTLELGVDIGALDLVLCRNVPPTPANYWQRVGRAGRRRRMAVVLVYCRRAVHDAYFFDQPEKLLGAPLRPPRFNLKNDVLVRKHVHAAVLSELLRIAKNNEPTRQALESAVPQYVREYLFEGEDDRYRTAPADVRTPLGGLIDANRQLLVDAVKRVFAAGWPAEAAAEVAPERLEGLVLAMPSDLQGLADHLHQRLMWVIETQSRLSAIASERLLTKDEERQRNRCGDYLHALKERQVRTYTLSVLAGEGFLPGYGLYDGGITAFPGWRGGAVSFELSRPQAIAVREFVPGNMLYANRGRYRTARYHFPVAGEEQVTEAYLVDLASGFVTTAGTPSSGYGDTSPVELPGLPIADVDLAHVSPIRDDETDRFQVPVTILGMARRHRRAGTAWTFGERTVHHVLGQGLRLVNAGPADRVRAGEPGYPVCIVCGATRSPYASPKEHQDFTDWHLKHCGRRPQWLALTANVVADAMHVQDLDDQGDAANLGEALRLGASQVLEMEPDDLQILPVPKADGRHDLYVYDPMPGGSGLLSQIIDRWDEIASTLHDLLDHCPGGCESSCYSCLRTGRNVYWHRFLDRHRALELISAMGTTPEEGHALQPLEDATFLGPVVTTNNAEDRLSEMLTRAGLDGFVGQHEVEIGPPYGRTLPDFAYVDAEVAVYLDGLSKGLHGNAERQRADAIIRDQLEDLGWKVVVIAASHLDDPVLLTAGFKRVARALERREAAADLTADGVWFHGELSTEDASGNGAGEVTVFTAADAQPYVRHVPLYSVRAAAGRFLENAKAEEEGWVEVPGALHDGMFAIRIAGRSMEPAIPDGALAVFRSDPAGAPLAGSREGKIVLAQLHEATDPEGGGSLTVKRYHSEKVAEDDEWRHTRIVLQSLNREVEDIELTPDQEVDVIAEFVTVLGGDDGTTQE